MSADGGVGSIEERSRREQWKSYAAAKREIMPAETGADSGASVMTGTKSGAAVSVDLAATVVRLRHAARRRPNTCCEQTCQRRCHLRHTGRNKALLDDPCLLPLTSGGDG
jgi:hypothetical protein